MFFFILLSKLPLWLLYRASDCLYFLMYYFPGYRKQVVRENLRNSFPGKSPQEIEVLSKKFYKNLTDLTMESLKILSISKEEVIKRVNIVNMELATSYLDRGQSVIVLTGHQCNWEWLLLASSAQCLYPVDAVYKPLHIGFIEKLLFKMRTRFDARPLAMKDVYRSIVRSKDQTRVLAMVADQTPAHSEIQYFTTFMNQPSAFFVGADKIARHTGYPVFFMDMRRVRRGYYEAELYARMLEKSILKNPSDWLWSHRRWKHREMKVKRKMI